MADIRYALQFTYSKSGRTIHLPPVAIDVDSSKTGIISGIITVPSANALALPLDGVTDAGMCVFRNLSADNAIEIGIDDNGFVSQDTLPPGGLCVRFMDTRGPIAKAQTAPSLLEYTIIDQ